MPPTSAHWSVAGRTKFPSLLQSHSSPKQAGLFQREPTRQCHQEHWCLFQWYCTAVWPQINALGVHLGTKHIEFTFEKHLGFSLRNFWGMILSQPGEGQQEQKILQGWCCGISGRRVSSALAPAKPHSHVKWCLNTDVEWEHEWDVLKNMKHLKISGESMWCRTAIPVTPALLVDMLHREISAAGRYRNTKQSTKLVLS